MSLNRSNLVLGITGSIATGKSTIAEMFVRLGAALVSADSVARDVLAPGTTISRDIIRAIGKSVAVGNADDVVDRAALGKLIYSDSSARMIVGAIMHPPIHAILSQQIDAAKVDDKFDLVVAEIPLLFENKLESFVDKILVVTCSEATQIARILQRQPGLTSHDALARIQSQLPMSQKIQAADYVIDSEQIAESVQSDVSLIHAKLAR